MRLGVVYRPPPSKNNKLKTSTFFEEWSVFLDTYATTFSDIMIMGDVNFHLDTICDSEKPRTRSVKYGDRAFSAAALALWNGLPAHIRCAKTLDNFKKLLKTYSFRQAFDES